MRTFASSVSVLILTAFLSPTLAQGPEPPGEGYDRPDERAPPGDVGPGPENEGAYDDEGYEQGAPPPHDPYEGADDRGRDEAAPPYDEEGPYDEGDVRERYDEPRRSEAYENPPDAYDQPDESPPVYRERRRYAEHDDGCGRRCGQHHRHWSRRRDTGYGPYSDTGLSGSGYAGGYYGTYPESY